MVATTLSYDYESSNNNPAAGFAYQGVNNPAQLTFATVDKAAHDNTTFFNGLNSNDIITCNGLTWTIVSVKVTGADALITINPPEAALPYGVTSFVFNVEPSAELPTFPLFTPIIPTSAFPPGGGVGSIGDPIGVPTFPPPTPPPIGTVPVGPLVGPAISPAPVPPSLAGVVQPQYKTGSATSPTAASWFPQFTTTGAYTPFPNNPPTGTPIVFANIWTSSTSTSITTATWATGQTTYTTAVAHGIPVGAHVTITGVTPSAFNGNFTTITGTAGSTLVVSAVTSPGTFVSGGTAVYPISVTPPSTPTTAQIILNGWGLPGPSGLGPGPPGYPNPPGAGLPHVFTESVPSGYTESAQRPGGTIFLLANPGQLHQSVPAPHSRRKRVSAHRAAGGDDRP